MLGKKVFLLSVLLFVSGSLFIQAQNSNWPQWRGPFDTGVALPGNPPTEFGEAQNLKWKTEIPGKGHATPIVWGDQIILLSAVAKEQKTKPERYKPERVHYNKW